MVKDLGVKIETGRSLSTKDLTVKVNNFKKTSTHINKVMITDKTLSKLIYQWVITKRSINVQLIYNDKILK